MRMNVHVDDLLTNEHCFGLTDATEELTDSYSFMVKAEA